MMWDIPINGNPEPYQQQQNRPMYDGHNNPLSPVGMPSPFGSPMPSCDYNAGPPAAFPPTSSYSYAGSTSSYLNVPDIPISGERRRATSGNIHHSHHSHHSHHTHHRVHSNPALLPPVPQAPPQHPSRPRPVSAFVNSAPSNFHTQSQQQQFQAPQHQYQAPQHQRVPGASAGTFQYSKCTGKKKALCIGINYIGTPQALRGCINDARHVRDFLVSKWGYRNDDIVMLTDDATNPRKRPTKNNIIEAMKWLVHNAQPNDSLVFHYSGHGGQTRDTDGDEVDGHDEVIYPMDYKREGHIVDDRMHKIMVRPLPAGCRLTAIFDCCHSGTVLDLPYIYGSDGRLKGRQVSQKARASRGTAADVISWSGSKDGQTSADTFAGGVAVGAMSYAFITSLQHNPKQTYQELLKSIRKILYPKYSQKPQLGSSHHIDTSLRFVM